MCGYRVYVGGYSVGGGTGCVDVNGDDNPPHIQDNITTYIPHTQYIIITTYVAYARGLHQIQMRTLFVIRTQQCRCAKGPGCEMQGERV